MNNYFLQSSKPIIHEPMSDNSADLSVNSSATAAIIWLHGLGADAHDFESIIPYLPIKEKHIRMIFPNAPIQPVTVNNSLAMSAWYDIVDFSLRDNDTAGIANATQYIHSLIDEQIAQGIDSKKIIIAGFSQGGAIAIRAGVSYTKPLAGIIGLSCYLLEKDGYKNYLNINNKNTPIFMGHGLFDQVVDYDFGKQSSDFLIANNHDLSFINYQMTHEVTMTEIEDVAKWIKKVL